MHRLSTAFLMRKPRKKSSERRGRGASISIVVPSEREESLIIFN